MGGRSKSMKLFKVKVQEEMHKTQASCCAAPGPGVSPKAGDDDVQPLKKETGMKLRSVRTASLKLSLKLSEMGKAKGRAAEAGAGKTRRARVQREKAKETRQENGNKACTSCGTQRTAQWRAGPYGPKTLCNACGVRYSRARLGGAKPRSKSKKRIKQDKGDPLPLPKKSRVVNSAHESLASCPTLHLEAHPASTDPLMKLPPMAISNQVQFSECRLSHNPVMADSVGRDCPDVEPQEGVEQPAGLDFDPIDPIDPADPIDFGRSTEAAERNEVGHADGGVTHHVPKIECGWAVDGQVLEEPAICDDFHDDSEAGNGNRRGSHDEKKNDCCHKGSIGKSNSSLLSEHWENPPLGSAKMDSGLVNEGEGSNGVLNVSNGDSMLGAMGMELLDAWNIAEQIGFSASLGRQADVDPGTQAQLTKLMEMDGLPGDEVLHGLLVGVEGACGPGLDKRKKGNEQVRVALERINELRHEMQGAEATARAVGKVLSKALEKIEGVRQELRQALERYQSMVSSIQGHHPSKVGTLALDPQSKPRCYEAEGLMQDP